MKLLGTLAICCMLVASILARIIIIDELGQESLEKQRLVVDIFDQDSKKTDGDSPAEIISKSNVKCNATPLTAQQEVSSGKLINTLHLIYKKIGIFPNGIHDSRRVLIKNVRSGKCVAMKEDSDGAFTKGVEASCKEEEKNKRHLVHLDHVGDGYVSLRFSKNYCIGAGFDPWSYVYVSNSDTWCKNSPSHQWAIVQRGNHVIFKQRESKRCLTSWPKWEELFVDNNDCKQNDSLQEFQICDPAETKCWPPNAPE